MTVDRARLRDLSDRLRREVDQLRELAGRDRDELLDDRIAMNAIKYGFVVAIEICIDMAHHIVAAQSLRAPETYADLFAVLSEVGIVEQGFARSLEDMARFRNLLVHQYADVDDARVLQHFTDLDDFDRFRRAVATAVLGDGS